MPVEKLSLEPLVASPAPAFRSAGPVTKASDVCEAQTDGGATADEKVHFSRSGVACDGSIGQDAAPLLRLRFLLNTSTRVRSFLRL